MLKLTQTVSKAVMSFFSILGQKSIHNQDAMFKIAMK